MATANHSILGQPLQLPCGAQLSNRIIKAAMSDSLGDGEGNATAIQARLYERWADGGAALSLIGEAQVGPHYPEKPGNLVLTPDTDLAALRDLATRGAQSSAQIWPQLGHAGALAHGPISTPKGPSPLDVDGLTCDGMTVAEIQALPQIYAQAATVAQQAGFTGVQVHAGHGFLFSQFLSPLFNKRDDAYGGPVAGRFRIIDETIKAVREAVGPSFPIGIKINSTDMLDGGLTEADALEAVRLLDQTSVDLIDISGGTYFPGAASSSDGKSVAGPYFAGFAKRAKAVTSVPIMLTGGIRTKAQAVSVLQSGTADAVGLARAMVLNPSLAKDWLQDRGGDPQFPRFSSSPHGGITAWYSMRLTALGRDAEAAFDEDPASALGGYDARDAERSIRWLKRFSDT